MDHYMEPLSSQAIDENNQVAVINANVAELESQQYEDDYNETLTATPVKANNDSIPQTSAPKKRKTTTSTGTRGGKQPASSKRKLQFTNDDVVEEEDEQQQQPSSLGKNT